MKATVLSTGFGRKGRCYKTAARGRSSASMGFSAALKSDGSCTGRNGWCSQSEPWSVPVSCSCSDALPALFQLSLVPFAYLLLFSLLMGRGGPGPERSFGPICGEGVSYVAASWPFSVYWLPSSMPSFSPLIVPLPQTVVFNSECPC